MKPFLKFAVLLFASIQFCACNNDDPGDALDVNPYQPALVDPDGLGGRFCYVLDDADLYSLKVYSGRFNKISRKSNEAFWDSIDATIRHEALSYQNIRILLSHRNDGTLGSDEEITKEIEEGTTKLYAYKKDILKKLGLSEQQYTALMKKRQNGTLLEKCCPQSATFVTAFHTGGASITANKTLFGKEPGTNLIEHFMVEGPNFCLPKGTLKDFGFVFWYDEAPVSMRAQDFFAKGTWLQKSHALWFADIPEEKYEYVTLTINLPVTCQYLRRYFFEGLNEIPMEEKTFTFRCTIHFGEISSFDEMYEKLYAENNQLKWAP